MNNSETGTVKMKKITGIALGSLLVAVGILYGLSALDVIKINISLDGWWTLFIIVPGIYGLFTSKDKLGNAAVLLIGIYLLLAARNIISYGVIRKLIIPTAIIMFGLKMIAKSLKGDSGSVNNSNEKRNID